MDPALERTQSSLPPAPFHFLSLAYSHFQGNQIVFLLVSERKQKKTKPPQQPKKTEFQFDKDLRKLTKDVVLC